MKVNRFFLEDSDGEMLDGPFKTKSEAEEARSTYKKQYKYTASISLKEIDTIDTPKLSERFY